MATESLTAPAPVYTVQKSCRVCREGMLELVLDLGTQFLVAFPAERDDTLPRAPLRLMRCESCGVLQLGHTVHPDLLYREFHYRSGINQTMRDALTDLVRDAMGRHEGGSWLDIGANDGYLLSQVPRSFTRMACEPAFNFAEDLKQHADVVVSDYFSGDHPDLQGKFNVITCAACFYDVADPDAFVAAIAKCLAPGGVFVNQLNDSPGMLRMNAIDAICHEHLMFYDIPTLKALYARHGLVITNISHNDINGGSVRLTARHRTVAEQGIELFGLMTPSREECFTFARRAGRWKQRFLDVLVALRYRGPLWGYGASTKFTVLAQYLDRPGLLDAIAERNPLKYGKMMVGSWYPIKSEDEMRAAKPTALIVGPWSFRDEIIRRESATLEAGTVLTFPLPSIEVVC